MTIPTFAAQKKAWSSPPVDDIGYIPSKDLLRLSDEEFAQTMTAAIENRYNGWRNYRGRWWDLLLPETSGKVVLDYGCGIGIEALQYTEWENEVWVADIAPDNLKVAERLFALSGEKLAGVFTIKETPPFIPQAVSDLRYFDIIHCAGVLHHIPNAREVVEAWHGWLAHEGEARLMLYSNAAWGIATGRAPHRAVPSHEHPDFEKFVQHWDAVGGYADWYDARKLEEWFGDLFTVKFCKPLTRDGAYVAARLVKK